MLKLIFLIIPILLTAFSYTKLNDFQSSQAQSQKEILYFPELKAVTPLSFGYTNFTSDLFWFRTVSYFGKNFRGGKDYKWLNHMCNVVISLDQEHREVYEFCSLMLSWETGQPEQSLKILEQGIKRHPDYWRFYYLKGIVSAIFMHDEKASQQSFERGALCPEAPPFMARLAARKLAFLSSPEAAVSFLKEMIRNSGNESEKVALMKHLKKTINDLNLIRLNEAYAEFVKRYKRKPTTVSELIVVNDKIDKLKDPWRRGYYIDSQEGKVKRKRKKR